MFEKLISLIVLFFVITDPLLSLAFFVAHTKKMADKERHKIAGLAIITAVLLAGLFLFFGTKLLSFFSTDIQYFRIAGGIMLSLLGIRMVRGRTAQGLEKAEKNSSKAIASIIATPLLTGPACITAIIVSTADYGVLVTGVAMAIVFAFTAILFYFASVFYKHINLTFIQVLTTILGMITLAWGVEFIMVGVTSVLGL